MCKVNKFADEHSANLWIKKLHKTSATPVPELRGYLCPECLSWHITKSIPDANLVDTIKLLNEVKELRIKVKNQKMAIETLERRNKKQLNK